jgi:glutaredoxin
MIVVKLFGLQGCDDCDTQKDILAGMGMAHEFIDINSSNAVYIQQIQSYNIDDIPTIVIESTSTSGETKKFVHSGILASHKISQAIDFIR